MSPEEHQRLVNGILGYLAFKLHGQISVDAQDLELFMAGHGAKGVSIEGPDSDSRTYRVFLRTPT